MKEKAKQRNKESFFRKLGSDKRIGVYEKLFRRLGKISKEVNPLYKTKDGQPKYTPDIRERIRETITFMQNERSVDPDVVINGDLTEDVLDFLENVYGEFHSNYWRKISYGRDSEYKIEDGINSFITSRLPGGN